MANYYLNHTGAQLDEAIGKVLSGELTETAYNEGYAAGYETGYSAGYDAGYAQAVIDLTPKYDSIFANNTWEQIIEACHNNKVPDTWIIGNQKSMTINGTSYMIDIIGKNHDAYADGSGNAPLTFQMHDCYGTTYAMHSSRTNVGGWASCDMRNTHLPEILSQMPSAVQAGIKEVSKLTSVGNASTTINTTADKLFLLSEIEVFGARNYSASGEGNQYDYYANGNSATKLIGSVASYWWLRSPRSTNTTAYCRVNSSGSYAQSTATTYCGVALAFCF